MKLYYSPGACSMSQHIVLREAGAKFEAVKVDLATHKTEKGEDYYAINPKGAVPALQFDNGDVLTLEQGLCREGGRHYQGQSRQEGCPSRQAPGQARVSAR